jgi:hypothetical protein
MTQREAGGARRSHKAQWFKFTNHAMPRRFRMFVDRPTPYDQVNTISPLSGTGLNE